MTFLMDSVTESKRLLSHKEYTPHRTYSCLNKGAPNQKPGP